jgi:hypothetical protein
MDFLFIQINKLDDYYLTGLIPKALKINHISYRSLYVLSSRDVQSNFRSKRFDWLIFGHFSHMRMILDKMNEIWNRVLNNRLN